MSSGKRGHILSVAMRSFMEKGFAATTTLEIATLARVSKRELYALVGNKEAMLAACISERGRRMRVPEGFPAPRDRAGLRAALLGYGMNMLREITDPDVVAVMRLGIAEAKRSPVVAQSVVAMGRAPASAALNDLLQSARDSGLLGPGELSAMVEHFHGLLWGGLLIWVLLGAAKSPNAREIERRAEETAELFLSLHGSAA